MITPKCVLFFTRDPDKGMGGWMVKPGGGDYGWTALLLALISINRGFYFSLTQGASSRLAENEEITRGHLRGPVRRQAPVLNQNVCSQAVSTHNTDKKPCHYNITSVMLTRRLDANKGVI